MSNGPAAPMEWDRFVGLLAGLDDTIAHLDDPDDVWLKQEAIQQLAMSLSQGYVSILGQDATHPQFMSFLNPVIKSAAPNPDYMYRIALIDGAGSYRVSGFRGTTLFVHISVGSGFMGVDDAPGPAIGNVDLDTLALGPDGAFSILFSAERPADYDGDWHPLDPRARTISIREASYDWLTEIDSRIAIERLDLAPILRRVPAKEIAHSLERLAGFPERYARIFLHFVNTLRQHPVNSVKLNTWSDIGGLQDQSYYEGLFAFDEDEALILETEVPETVRYWSVLLADQLFNTIDWEKCQSSLNGFQARRDADGKFRAVIAAADPGVPNWLDTGGRYRGIVQGRWYQASSAPQPALLRVKLADVRAHLPADTPAIDAAARKESLLARFRGAQFRRKW